MAKKNFLISGMHCHSCARLIEMSLEELSGIKSAKVDFASQKAIVKFDDSKLSAHKIIGAIKGTGYVAKAE